MRDGASQNAKPGSKGSGRRGKDGGIQGLDIQKKKVCNRLVLENTVSLLNISKTEAEEQLKPYQAALKQNYLQRDFKSITKPITVCYFLGSMEQKKGSNFVTKSYLMFKTVSIIRRAHERRKIRSCSFFNRKQDLQN